MYFSHPSLYLFFHLFHIHYHLYSGDAEHIMSRLDKGLIDFGLIPEMIGRLPIIVETKELSQEDIKRIITEPKNNILDQYKELFRLDGIELIFNEDALELIYKLCYESKLGARGIRSVFEIVLKDAMFNSPGKRKKVIVTKTIVNNLLKSNDENFYIKNDK